ncbi:hypothetical protein GCM10023063_28360 [Arthrobacter methylotrophus]|uniref:DUF222 domain-containing protein n=1 Tax=Arthrobacter methylotrophus TaxID=121291 RepID=A0ABV5URL3_9MICC
MAENTTEQADAPVTDDDVAAAQAAADDAQALIARLEEAVASGDETVTAEQIVAQESLSRFAKLRAEATRRKAAKTREAARLRDCEALRAEIEQHATDGGEQLAGLLRKVEESITAFVSAVGDRNALVTGWVDRAKSLDIPEHKYPVAPPAEHGRVGLGFDGKVIAGMRHVERVNADHHINSLLGVLNRAEVLHDPKVNPGAEGDIYAALAAVDAPIETPTNLYFYRNTSGAVFAKDQPFADDEVKRAQLTKISRAEAWGE